MENLSPQRPKNIVLAALAVLIAAGFFYIIILYPSYWHNEKQVYRSIIDHIKETGTALKKEIYAHRVRAEFLFNRYRSAEGLQHQDVKSKEALIVEENGLVKKYFGEIYYFGVRNIDVGQWTFSFSSKDEALYFCYRLDKNIYYLRYFGDMVKDSYLEKLDYFRKFSDLKFSSTPLTEFKNQYNSNPLDSTYLYTCSYLLDNSNRQLILNLKVSQKDINEHYRKNQKIMAYALLLLLIFTLFFYGLDLQTGKVNRSIIGIGLFAIPADLLLLLPLVFESNLFIHVSFKSISFIFKSTFQVIAVLVFLLLVLQYLKRFFIKQRIAVYLLFNLALVGIIVAGDAVLKGVNFGRQYQLNYFSLATIIFLLHALPILIIRDAALEYYVTHKSLPWKDKIIRTLIFVTVQTAVIVCIGAFFTFNTWIISISIISLIVFIFLFFYQGFVLRAVIIFLIAISSYNLIQGSFLDEKKDFIKHNLKDIFLNQGNYAKFVAREIVNEINRSSSDLAEFFQPGMSHKLETIWRRSIAYGGNIASGIFVVSKDNEIINQFNSQISFMEISIGTMFPFWAMEETSSEVLGKEIPIAVAYTGVNRVDSVEDYKSEYLGYIIVEVQNSPELLLRYQDKINIFTLDNKIDGRDLSYIKLNSNKEIVENPSNLNLENIEGILENDNRWIKFEYMNLTFKGYIFKSTPKKNPTIIFFPQNTFFKDFSEVIILFLYFSLFFLTFYIKELRRIDWRSIYYSFSIRVFFLLLLISLLTAVVFSIFFINFTSQSLEQSVNKMVYENGRNAQSIGIKLLKTSGGFSANYLNSISQILNADVSLYNHNGLIDTSNYRAQVPTYVHSRIEYLLNEKNQKFVLVEEEGSFKMYSKIYDYTFMIQFPNSMERSLSKEPYYSSFVISLFFILFVIGFSAAFFFRNKILSPIKGLNKGMSEVEMGHLPTLKNIPSEIEIKSLYQGFNSMIEGIREQQRNISEISRMKTIIKLGRRVAHEVKNPLTPIKLSAEQILMALKDKKPNYEEIIKQSVNYIIDETDHLRKVSYGFLDLSRIDEINPEEFDFIPLVQEEMFNVQQLYSHIAFTIEIPDGEPLSKENRIIVKLDRIKIKQVLKNIINNSIDAIGDKKGEIRFSLHKDNENQRLLINITDNGSGMTEAEASRLFEADYSTKEVGTGLGLFIVKRIIDIHKGHIEFKSEKNIGTTVIIDLPLQV